MPIADASTILAADVNAMATMQLAAIQGDNAQLPAGFEHHFYFPNLVASTAAERRKSVFIVPFDCYVETLAVEGNDHTASSTTTAVLTDYINIPQSAGSITIPGTTGKLADIVGDVGPLANFPIAVAGTTGAGINKIARLLNDNAKTKQGLDPASTSRSFRVLLKGSTVMLTVNTTSIATPSQTHVVLCLRQFFGRDQ